MPGGNSLRGDSPAVEPKRVLFSDSRGPVLLIGCRARGFHANAWGPGSGTLWARAAIMGVPEDREFDRPHGLQTEISGLREWLGITSWREVMEREGDRWRQVLTSVPTKTVSVSEDAGMSLDFRPAWGVAHEEGG